MSLVDLPLHPLREGPRGLGLGYVADCVGVKKIPGRGSTLRPATGFLAGMMSSPTGGDRRSAARTPPLREDRSAMLPPLANNPRRDFLRTGAWPATGQVPCHFL